MTATGGRQIMLPEDKVTFVDECDFLKCSQIQWGLLKHDNGTLYVVHYLPRPERPRALLMHRFILGVTERHTLVDHWDRDGLNNRRQNLRICTKSQNNANQIKTRGSSKYKGVVWHVGIGKWVARVGINGKQIGLGTFDSEEIAAREYDRVAREVFGEFSRLNFPIT